MSRIKIGLAHTDSWVGAFDDNFAKICRSAERVAFAQSTFGVFGEQVISGYPSEDLTHWPSFVAGQMEKLVKFARFTKTLEFKTIFVVGLTVAHGGHNYNCAALVYDGNIIGIVPKQKLPNYDVFYEMRWFTPGLPYQFETVTLAPGISAPFGDIIFATPFCTFALEVCEDIWSNEGPMARRAYSGAELVMNISASPFRIGVVDTRREMIATRASDNQATIVYCNKVGGQGSLVFDGGGFINQNGKMVYESPRWQETASSCVVDLDITRARRTKNTTWRTDAAEFARKNSPVQTVMVDMGDFVLPQYRVFEPLRQSKSVFMPAFQKPKNPRADYFNDLIEAMIWALGGYFEKTKAFQRIGVALSGGRDSALSFIIAYLYAKRKGAHVSDFLHAFSMPSRFNSKTTKSIARMLCQELGVSFMELPIEEAARRETRATKMMLGGKDPTAITKQNIQARIRAARMWNWANTAHAMMLQTGNMSEKAVGYTTTIGDLSGAYSLLGNLPKTVINELLRYLYEVYKWKALGELLKTKASAELANGQSDEADLMPFPVLDACFFHFVGDKMDVATLYLTLRAKWSDSQLRKMDPTYTKGKLKEWVEKFITLFFRSIYKWVQAPETAHLASVDLDRERALQLQAASSTQWLGNAREVLASLPD